MFTKILIANRGEIACRVIETARDMGVRTVAVYSDADARARHVELADEAVRLGPPPVGESYLKGDRIIQAAKDTGAQAIHPGYGFLSENPEFIAAVEAAGLRFIGPSADSVRKMGLKDAAKKLMEEAGVPVVPGYHGTEQDADFLAKEAEQIGYPVLIKARAGGGGKGMRLVENSKDFKAALDGAQREGEASFGDGRVLIEKFITSPRHIEIQVFGDDHGNVVHLFERDCSLQRRHQKVIEEAPAPGMTEEMRAAMGDAAVKAAQAINYSGAGTIEFIVDGSDGLHPDKFWFMEMNTRLQVEHPVTEAITGQDLVEWQLRVASGEELPLAQEELAIDGHAFEARLYAEDAAAGFLPAIGRLDRLEFPWDARIDTGVDEGDSVTPHYDPMIAKVITHGADRTAALDALARALAETRVAGLTTNKAFLHALTQHGGFRAGEVDTGLIGRELDALTAEDDASDAAIALALLVARGHAHAGYHDGGLDGQLAGFRLWSRPRELVRIRRGEAVIDGFIRQTGPHDYVAMWEDKEVALSMPQYQERGQVWVAGRAHDDAFFAREGGDITTFLEGVTTVFHWVDPLEREDEAGGGDRVIAPMPGLVKLVAKSGGETVEEGDLVMVLEAMKMEHSMTAPRAGTLGALPVKEGAQVTAGDLLFEMEPEDG
ncbi:acetyl/propionyl/methylcrotonyl-CoA carboxylase subunit alpha [Paracoccaceae bacterium GXU_MW_L88]